MTGFAHPEALVETEWLDQHRNDDGLRVVEVDVDTAAYDSGHIPGAVGWDWQSDLCDAVERDIVARPELETLLGRSGIRPETIVVLYGDNNNWFACWAFWQLKIYGHGDVRILDGGRKKWLAEGRELTTEPTEVPVSSYSARRPDFSVRAYLAQVVEELRNPSVRFVDVRSPDEWSGRILAPPGLPETCQRGGHLPGAINVPWNENCNDDGTFKSRAELEELYAGIGPSQRVVVYCRIGERSSLTWFVLKYLLGRENVVNYDGSWTEWGNLVGAPIAVGDAE